MSYSKKVASNTIIQLVGRVASTAVSFFIIALLTRRLGVTGYGEYSIVFAYLGLFAVLADFGFFYLLIRKLSAREGDPSEIASNLITMRTVAGIVIYLISIGLAQFFPYSSVIKEAIALGTISFLATSVQNTIFGVFQVYYQMRWAVISDNLSRIITLGLVYYFLLQGTNLNLIVLAYVIGNTVGTVFLIWKARQILPLKFGFNFKLWRSIFNESIVFGIAIVFSYLYFKVDALILSVLKGSTDVGIYAPGVKILEVILILPQMFIATILPIYSRYIAEKDRRLEQTIQKTFDLLSLAMAAVVGGIFVLSPQIIQLIAGPDFLHTSTVTINGLQMTAATSLSILVFTAVFSYIEPTFNYLLIAAGKQKLLVIPNIFFLAFNVVLNLLLIPRFSYIGAAVATIVTEILVMITMVYLSRREIGFHLSYDRLIKSIIAAVIMVVALSLVTLPLLAEVILGGVIYVIAAFTLGAIRPEMIDILKPELPSHDKA